MIRLLCIGKMKDKALRLLQDEYVKRISSFDKIEITEVKDEPNENVHRAGEAALVMAKEGERALSAIKKEDEAALVMAKEGERALSAIKKEDFVILLDLHGEMWDSETFAAKLGGWHDAGKRLTFVIAGSLGPSPELAARANARWKLSDLTFTHLMTRVLVLEQIYRGFMIGAGRNYHK